MSSFTVVGFFGVRGGRRESSIKPSSSARTWHAFYDTALQCSSGSLLDAQLRIYSRATDIIHPDNTVAFVIGKVFAPPNAPVLIDAYCIVPCPGDVDTDSYEDSIPNVPFPWLFGLGSVSAPAESFTDHTKAFVVTLTEYVRDSAKLSNVQCVYDAIPRWNNTPTPNPLSVTQFIGTCLGVTTSGMLRVMVENIVLNVGPSVGGHNGPGGPHTPPPSGKRRRFASSVPSPTASFAASSPTRTGVVSGNAIPGNTSSVYPLAASMPSTNTLAGNIFSSNVSASGTSHAADNNVRTPTAGPSTPSPVRRAPSPMLPDPAALAELQALQASNISVPIPAIQDASDRAAAQTKARVKGKGKATESSA